MSREIRFEYGFQSVNGIVKKKYYLHEIPFISQKCDVWNDLPIVYVREFTGLHDKNGVEAYENDIVSDESGTIGVIEYDLTEACFIVAFKKHDIQSLLNFSEWATVIGNIHQHSELLK